jgi:hypothetical protein
MKNILTIGYEIPGYSNCYHEITSNISMLDGDIIVFCPEMEYLYATDGYFDGKPKLTETSSRQMEKDSTHWRKEIIEALKAHKTIFVFLAEKEEFSIFTHKDFSGTGRSRSTTTYFSSYDNYQWIPLNNFAIINVKGTKIQKPKNLSFLSYFNAFQNELRYDVILEAKNIDPTFQTSSGTRIVGGKINTNEGNLILIPYPKYDNKNDFTEEDKKGYACWSKKALDWGAKLVSCLINIEKGLSSNNEKTPPPTWLADKKFALKKEMEVKKEITTIEKRIEKLNKELNYSRDNLANETQIKDLLYEQGKPLENVVIKALKILGYQAEGYDNGTLELDQIIISPEGERFIGECEGKDSTAIDIKKFRQLADAIHEDYERKEVQIEAIGLLFGNPHRLSKPDIRKDFFTKKCLQGAERRKYGLIKTPDLFNICKYLIENIDEDYKKKCREAITKGLGGIIKFPKIPKDL